MPPHEALVNADVLDYVFGHFTVDPETREAVQIRSYLRWAALSCRAFSRPALNALWRTLDSLLPLLKLLPSLKLVDHVYVVRGTIQEDDWTRFDSYARRVKEFVYHRDRISVDPSVYFYIAQSRTSPMLPTLYRFRSSSSAPSIPDILLFLSSSLHRVEFVTGDRQQEPTIGGFLFVLTSVAPSLKHLSIDGQLSISSLTPIAHMEHLCSLRLRRTGKFVDASLLKQLGALERLSCLTIDLEHSPVSEADTSHLRAGFKALETLDISGDLETITGILTEISTGRLISISISSWESSIFGPHHYCPSDWVPLFEIIESRWPDTLHSLVIDNRAINQEIPRYADYWGFLTIFKPLCALSQLEYLEIRAIPLLQSTDEDFHDLVSAWPKIKSLFVPFTHAHNSTTLLALHSVAEFCPHLKYLQMSIRTDNLPSFSVTPVFSHNLEILSFRDSTVGDPSLVARHLDLLFPRLQSIRAEKFANEWKEVEKLVHMCQDVRFHAREQITGTERV